MIHFLEGVVAATGPDYVVLNVSGIGFLVKTPSHTAEDVGNVGTDAALHTCLMIRDDNPVLYGFGSADERALFLELTTVSGVGPRLALALLGAMRPDELASAIVAGDTVALSQVPGIGKKIAARVCLELASKLDAYIGTGTVGAQLADGELVEALTALGYTVREAVDVARKVGADAATPLEQRIRKALQLLSSR